MRLIKKLPRSLVVAAVSPPPKNPRPWAPLGAPWRGHGRYSRNTLDGEDTVATIALDDGGTVATSREFVKSFDHLSILR